MKAHAISFVHQRKSSSQLESELQRLQSRLTQLEQSRASGRAIAPAEAERLRSENNLLKRLVLILDAGVPFSPA